MKKEFKQSKSSSLSVFDLDGTLLVGNSSFQFGTFLYRKGQLSLLRSLQIISSYVQHLYFGTSMTQVHGKAFDCCFVGRSRLWLEQHVQDFLRERLSQLTYSPAAQKLSERQVRGDVVAIFSSSPDFLVKPIAAYFGVEHWRASHYPFSLAGHLEQRPIVFHGADKAQELRVLATRLGIAIEETIAYSDSSWDLPFLKSAGQAVAVRPDRRLRTICLQSGWEVLE